MSPASRLDCLTKLLIFLSGAAGLIYEIVWIKRSALVFGSSSLALATVLAVFFLGLGLGSYGFGRIGAATRRPLQWCAGLELLLALYGLSSPLLFSWADDVYGLIYRTWGGRLATLLPLRGVLVALILIPPTVLMGGTLPLYCRHLVRQPTRIGTGIGLAYGINTFGAAVGCAAAGFALIPELGLTATTRVAATLNLMAAGGFHWLAVAAGPLPTSRLPTAIAAATRHRRWAPGGYLLVGLLFFLTGALALANELLWTRFLANFIRNSVYTYTLTLTVVLAGAVLGSLMAAPISDRAAGRRSLLGWFAVLQSGSAALILILTHLPARFWIGLSSSRLLPHALLMLAPAIVAGASFPLANRIAIRDPAEVSAGVGSLTAMNILGCVAGSLLTGFLILPEFGLSVGIYVSTAMGLGAGLLATAAALVGRGAKSQAAWGAGAFVILCALLWGLMPVLSPVAIPKDLIARSEPVLDFTEGYNSTLAVIQRQRARTLLVSQTWQGSDQKSHQIMAAHVPMILHPEAKTVLVVGMGVGQTASRFLDHGIDRLDVVDIEPRLFDFVRRNFPSTWMDDGRVRLLAEDGRNYVKHSARRYDVLSVEVGQLYRPGVDVFYTTEFYREARARLTPDGLIAQFVPLEFLQPAEFAGVLASFLAVFPDAALWYNSNELLLLGFNGEPRRLSTESFARSVGSGPIGTDLEFSYWGGPRYRLNHFPVFLAGFLAAGSELRALAEGGTEYTDDQPRLAYLVSDFKVSDLRAVTLAGLIQKHLSPLTAAVRPGAIETAALEQAEAIRRDNIGDLAASNILELVEDTHNLVPPEPYIVRAQEALQWNPHNLRALRLAGAALIQANRDVEAIGYLRRASELDDSDPLVQRKLGFALVRSGAAEAAIPHLERALQAEADDVETINALAVGLANLNRLSEAIVYFRRASALQPDNDAATRNLRAAEALLQQRGAASR